MKIFGAIAQNLTTNPMRGKSLALLTKKNNNMNNFMYEVEIVNTYMCVDGKSLNSEYDDRGKVFWYLRDAISYAKKCLECFPWRDEQPQKVVDFHKVDDNYYYGSFRYADGTGYSILIHPHIF